MTLFVRRFLSLLIGLPVCIAVVALAVANRKMVTVSLDPFNPDSATLAVTLPLFALIFATLILGVVIGGGVTWLSQGRFRREARRARKILPPEPPRAASGAPALPAPIRNA
ncbi:lipopolysaccharide assembly protein LapA domain-containing protein [Xanthobacter sp. DSM 24535]|uniref:lipopolysaccharide assembly protein LapA domain-containing protein n=1 Tax=Roseixanthobacter psychrophilus TaxID=3119917 RepID=UPI00372BAEFF